MAGDVPSVAMFNFGLNFDEGYVAVLKWAEWPFCFEQLAIFSRQFCKCDYVDRLDALAYQRSYSFSTLAHYFSHVLIIRASWACLCKTQLAKISNQEVCNKKSAALDFGIKKIKPRPCDEIKEILLTCLFVLQSLFPMLLLDRILTHLPLTHRQNRSQSHFCFWRQSIT